jgi:hypothetical protein
MVLGQAALAALTPGRGGRLSDMWLHHVLQCWSGRWSKGAWRDGGACRALGRNSLAHATGADQVGRASAGVLPVPAVVRRGRCGRHRCVERRAVDAAKHGSVATVRFVSDVSCASARVCVAVGWESPGNQPDDVGPAVEQWNGRRWTRTDAAGINANGGPEVSFSPTSPVARNDARGGRVFQLRRGCVGRLRREVEWEGLDHGTE